MIPIFLQMKFVKQKREDRFLWPVGHRMSMSVAQKLHTRMGFVQLFSL